MGREQNRHDDYGRATSVVQRKGDAAAKEPKPPPVGPMGSKGLIPALAQAIAEYFRRNANRSK